MITVFHRAAIAAFLLASLSAPAFAITGGVSVRDVLAGEKSAPALEAIATGVSAVTLPLIRVDANGQTTSLCSSTLIHPRVVLTAAHCVYEGGFTFEGLTVLFPNGAAKPERRQAIDMVVHPTFVEIVKRASGSDKRDIRAFLRKRGAEILMTDFALILLHRPAPGSHELVPMVPSGFRDDRSIRKIIAGYGKVDDSTQIAELDLRFADLRGNTRDYQGALSGGSEIIMESYFRDGAKVNVCNGDSGGPVLMLDRDGTQLRQIGVTSAGDIRCRSYAIFAPIDAQRRILRQMFSTLMQGEQGAEKNPF